MSFDKAVQWIAESSVSTSTATKLRLYSLYKVATTSPRPTTSRPGMLDFSGRAKWDAWDSIGKSGNYEGSQGKELAKEEYLQEAIKIGYSEEMNEENVEQVKPVGEKKEQAVSVSQIKDEFVDDAPISRLHEIAIDGDVAALQSFLSTDEGKSCQIDHRDSYGYSALHLAADRGHVEIVKILLENGADKDAKDEDGNTALDLARLADQEELVKLFSSTS